MYFVGILKVTEEKSRNRSRIRIRKSVLRIWIRAIMSSDPEHCKLQCHKSTPEGVYSLDLWQMTDRNTRGKPRRGNLGLLVD